MKYLRNLIVFILIALLPSVALGADAYIDNTNSSGNLTGADWDFTNASTTVTEDSAGGNALAELAVGDYVRDNGGTQWYKVTAVTDDDNIEITPAFQQGTSEGVNCNYNNEDGSAADGNAFVHPNQATTDTVRTDGEIIYCKANQTHTLAGVTINFYEDAVAENPHTLMGCTNAAGGSDPWGDNDDTHVIFTFSDTAFQVYVRQDNGWKFENIDFIESSHADGPLEFSISNECIIEDCVFRDNATRGLTIAGDGQMLINACIFYSNGGISLRLEISDAIVTNCDFYGGGDTTDYGIYINNFSILHLEDCAFGVTGASTHDTADINFSSGGMHITARRVKLAEGLPTNVGSFTGGFYKAEDHNQVIGDHIRIFREGTTEMDDAEADLGGGADNTIKITPTANISTHRKLLCMEWEEQAVPAAEQTRGVAIKVTTNPGSYPANTELYLEAEYYDHAVNDTVDTAVSTAVLAADDTWVWFPVVFTPAQVQKVRYRVYLGTQENAESYYIDNQLYDADPT